MSFLSTCSQVYPLLCPHLKDKTDFCSTFNEQRNGWQGPQPSFHSQRLGMATHPLGNKLEVTGPWS